MNLSWGAVIGAALADSVNPCAFAVLIYLVTFLTSIKGSRKKVLTLGGVFVGMIFLSYFLIGLGLLGFIYKIPHIEIIYKVLGAIVIVAGLINIKDFFWYGKGLSLAIPESQKPRIEGLIQKATLPAALLLGILVSLFELPCTGSIYIVIIGHLSKGVDRCLATTCLLVYNMVFILPMIVLLILSAIGISSKKMETWREKNRRWLKLFMGLVMILLGIMMISEIL